MRARRNARMGATMNKVVEERTRRTEWYREARFGMFIHWGLYAIPARGEWLRSTEQLTREEYEPFKDEFTTENYNPKEWARMAKEAGMKYAVLPAKHHDGFCLFESKLTDFKSTNAPCGRDLVREFLEAFRAEGIRVGLYYSVIDWRHPDFPHYGDMHHPMRNRPEYSNKNRNFDNYLEYMFGQIKELLTDYGKLDVMWFDFSYGNMKCDTWKAKELIEMVRSIQPDVIIDNRLEGSGENAGSIRTLDPTPYSGDFASPEQMIPPAGIRDEAGNPIPWESCITLNNNWGYAAHDHHYKSAKMVIHMRQQGREPAAERRPQRQGGDSRRVGGHPAGGRRLDEEERKEHLRLRLCGAPEAGVGALHPQGECALRPCDGRAGGGHLPGGHGGKNREDAAAVGQFRD